MASKFVNAVNRFVADCPNAPHHPSLANFPHHFHAEDGIIQASMLTGDPEQDITQITGTVNAILGR